MENINKSQDIKTEVMSFMLTDIVGSTRLWEADPKLMASRLEVFDQIIHSVAAANRGNVVGERGEGDSHFCVFASPADCLNASVELQTHLIEQEFELGLAIRAAVHTGEIQHRGNDYYGPVINRCARLREIAHGRQILVSGSTELLAQWTDPELTLKSLGFHRLRDLAEPIHVFQLCHPGLPQHFSPLNSLSRHPNNLPIEMTSFVGRTSEIHQLSELVASKRLVTITGTGGSGKTRMALQVAAHMSGNFSHGVWFIDLSLFDRESNVIDSIATSLGLESGSDPFIQISQHLADGRQLLVLDNCEHLQSFCQTLATSLLKNCPSLSLLCTSRLALALPSEQVFRCPGLSVPTLDDDNSVLSSEAVSLLLERCGQRGTSLEVNEITGPKIADLCRRLDGLPLGIEIISGAFSVLSLEVILDQLSRFLANETGMEGTSARQRTMSTAVQWSISLLPDAASELLSRLTIFQSSWTVEAASEICGFGKVRKALVYELVRNLVSHSLLFSEREPSGGVRIRMLQSTRDILLMGKKPSVQLERRFVDHFLNLAKDAEARTLKDLNQFGFEYPHIVRALELAADLSIPAWIDAALALRYFWIRVGRYNEGVGWLTRAAESLTLDPFRRGLALNAAGALSIRMADEASAKSYLEQAEICLLEKGGIDLVKVMSNLAMIDIKAGNYVAATERLERCELECTRENDTSILGLVLINLGVSYLYRDIHDDHTLEIFNRARDVARQIGNSSMEGIALGNVAETHLLRNEYGAAVETAKRMFSLGDQAVELFEFTGTIYMLSVVASRIGKPEVASVLYATGEKLAQQHNFVFHPRQSALHEETKVFLGVHQSEFKVAQKKVRNKSVSELFTIASETLDSLSQTN